VTLVRVGPGGKEMATAPTPLTRGGTYALRFANFDCRLRVWVNGRPIDFGADADYSPADPDRFVAAVDAFEAAVGAVGAVLAPAPDGHTLQNDVLAPAGVGAKGSVEISHVVLWMDTFFTPSDGGPANTDTVDTFYVQPGHYLCLGDNSAQSSDSRRWGLVPERLMLGRAVFVFFPTWPFVPWHQSRLGFIR
jgi:signal peptidase I